MVNTEKSMIVINNRVLDEDVHQFLKNLLDPEMFGHAVTAEVRDEARKLLGMLPVEKNPNWKTNWGIAEGV